MEKWSFHVKENSRDLDLLALGFPTKDKSFVDRTTAAIHRQSVAPSTGILPLKLALRTMASRPRSRVKSEPMVPAFFPWLWPTHAFVFTYESQKY